MLFSLNKSLELELRKTANIIILHLELYTNKNNKQISHALNKHFKDLTKTVKLKNIPALWLLLFPALEKNPLETLQSPIYHKKK